jgi:hypothetical protein
LPRQRFILREFREIDRPSEGSTHTRRDGAWAIVRGPYFNQPEDCFHAGYAYPVSGVCELIGMPLANTEPDAPGVVPQSIKGHPSDRAGKEAERFSSPAIDANALEASRSGGRRQCRWTPTSLFTMAMPRRSIKPSPAA